MMSRPVHQGWVGVNRSNVDGLFLLQVTETFGTEVLQARAVMNERQLKELIERLTQLLPEKK